MYLSWLLVHLNQVGNLNECCLGTMSSLKLAMSRGKLSSGFSSPPDLFAELPGQARIIKTLQEAMLANILSRE